MTFVAVAMSLQKDCGKFYYGNCDPGPGCTNLDHSTYPKKFLYLDCADRGKFQLSNWCDGTTHCKRGRDEKYCNNKLIYPENHIFNFFFML